MILTCEIRLLLLKICKAGMLLRAVWGGFIPLAGHFNILLCTCRVYICLDLNEYAKIICMTYNTSFINKQTNILIENTLIL